ncbi:hypothetical protein Ndes2526B_g03951 [Nannochloris sp. 'desiccata']
MKERADQHRRPSPFKVGDKVSISRKVLSLPDTTDRKLQYRFYGPFTVKALRGPNAVAVELVDGKPLRSFNVSNLKPWIDDDGSFPGRDYAPPAPELINNEKHFAVESFARNRWRRFRGWYKEQFYVRWKGYPASDNTWEDVKSLMKDMPDHGFLELLPTLKKRLDPPKPRPDDWLSESEEEEEEAPKPAAPVPEATEPESTEEEVAAALPPPPLRRSKRNLKSITNMIKKVLNNTLGPRLNLS